METLAPELIQEILQHVDCKADLASFRLVQRSFAELAQEYVFRLIDVKPTYSGLHPLLDISRHAGFARHVKEVVLHLDDFRTSIWLPCMQRLKTEGLEHGTVTQKRNVLQAVRRDFRDFQTSPDYTGILSAAFMRLPRLEAIRVNERPPHKGGIDPLTAEEMEFHSLHDYEAGHQQGWGSQDSFRAFSALVGAAYFAGTKLVSFRSNADIMVVFERSELVRRAAVVFQRCPVLELALSQTDSSLLFELLVPAVALRCLALRFDLQVFRESVSAFSKIIENRCVWSALQEVRITTMCMHSVDSLVEFLQRHQATLRRLALWDCRLATGSWVAFVICVKVSLKLSGLELGGLVDSTKTYSEGELEGMVGYVLNPNCGELPVGLRSVS